MYEVYGCGYMDVVCLLCILCVVCCGVINVYGKYEGIGVEYWMMVMLLGVVLEIRCRKHWCGVWVYVAY